MSQGRGVLAEAQGEWGGFIQCNSASFTRSVKSE